MKHGRHSAQLEELVKSLEQWGEVAVGEDDEVKLQDLMQQLTLEVKEFSDGEMTVALTSMTTDKEEWHDYLDVLKSFSHHHRFDGIVVLLSISDSVHHPRQQVAVYSNNTDILKQICSELEESSSWSLSGELEALESLQVYHIPLNTSASSGTPPLLAEEIQGILKDFVDRRSSVLACHPSSRTSSTEGVAGSVEFSQGSSGINDMDGSDIERAEGGNGDTVAIARVMGDGEEDAGGAGVNVGGELVSPDSGMTTIRSSRSSKESSVFLSDDSPVGEVIAGGGPAAGPGGLFLRNPSPLGLLSLSPPVPPERRKHRSSRQRSDNFDLFHFDPLHSSGQSMPAGGEVTNSGERGDEDERRAGSSSLSELDELSFLDFSAPNSVGGLESGNCSIDRRGSSHGNEMIDTVVPPTPVNSLVGSRPPSSCGVRFFPEDVVERINCLQHKDSVSSSLSETWDELGFDTQGALSSSDNNMWNRPKDSESPPNILEEVGGKDLVGNMTEKESRQEILKSENSHHKGKSLEPQLSLITEQTESYENWNPDSALKGEWKPITLVDLQLTPPEEDLTGKGKPAIIGAQERAALATKKTILNTLTPDTSKEEDEGVHGKKREQQMELLDFWTYSAQKGFLKSDSGTTTSYPESLDMWNMTIRDDSLSPLTTPENLSQNSGSFCGLNTNIKGGTSVESPLGYSDGGMEMWNTTIQEDSSSALTTPEAPENGKDLSHMDSMDPSDTVGTHANKKEEEEANLEEKSDTCEAFKQTSEVVKIVIEAAEGTMQSEETEGIDVQGAQSRKNSAEDDDDTSTYEGTDVWQLPICGMVTSTSEYDNVGAGTWSLASSPDTSGCPVADMIQLEEQSSPFIAVSKPILTDQRVDITNKEQPDDQVFLFEAASEMGGRSREGSEEIEWIEQPRDHSPFLLVNCSTGTRQISQCPEEAAEPQIQAEQTFPAYVTTSEGEQVGATDEISRHVDGKTTETVSLSVSPGGEKDLLENPDSGRTDSPDELGLEMEYIIVSGTVKEATKEWHDRTKRSERQSKGTKKSLETFSMLSYAASVLQRQAQAAKPKYDKDTPPSKLHQVRGTDSAPNTDQNQPVRSTHYEATRDSATDSQVVPEIISPSQSKNDSEAFHQSDSKPTSSSQSEGNYDSESSIVPRSVSPSLRYPSDHFLKTREEVYVHSQISMEDSDEGGETPPAPSPCPASLGDFQVWGAQLRREDTSQTTSEPQSPVLTNSSASHASSLISTPVNETSISIDKRLGLPFSGDLMEEENDDEEQDEETDTLENAVLPKWTSEVQREREERQEFASSDLLSFSDDLIGGSSFQQAGLQTHEQKRDGFPLNRVDYCDGRPIRTEDWDKWSIEQQPGDTGASQDNYLPDLRRHQDVTPELSSHPAQENAAYQWSGQQNTTQGQTQYGYNYHHIDQRTENQCTYPAFVESKSSRQQDATDVYAEFTTDATATKYRYEQTDNYFEAGDKSPNRLGDTHFRCQDTAESQYIVASTSLCTSDFQYSQYPANSQGQYESQSDHAHYQSEGKAFYQSDVHTETEDHARYVLEGYVHFPLSRHSQQEVGAAGMMMKMASNEDATDDMENKEDQPSSADISGGSNQRRKLAAPPMNVSLDHSEGSLLSEDTLDTEDDGLDTGDDLDVNLDELDTPDEADSLEFNKHGDSEESVLGAGAASRDPGHRAAEESRLWRSVVIGEQEHRIDMKCIEPYKRVISHGGYYAEQKAIIVFAACFLPESNCDNYNYVMENLFLYVISTLELMVAEDYIIVYLNGATPRRRMPGFTWMKRCYQMIDRRLKKNLKMFIIVHPSWFIRTLLGITRPFISSKFSSKIKYVHSLQELGEIIPMEYVHIPHSIVRYDQERSLSKFACTRLDTELQDTAAE
ncbi:unnamed protein product [Oreochromis niloticus]|nr:unnamed protein product [Mustela putorius furo]